jgi:hypothetical protein
MTCIGAGFRGWAVQQSFGQDAVRDVLGAPRKLKRVLMVHMRHVESTDLGRVLVHETGVDCFCNGPELRKAAAVADLAYVARQAAALNPIEALRYE